MKTVILAGGMGTRLSEETTLRPKPMVEIGGMPMLWHVMRLYSDAGFNEFFVALGYKGHVVKQFFLDYYRLRGNVTVSLATGAVDVHDGDREDWRVHLVDTGTETMSGGRLKRLAPSLSGGTFMVSYGDGVAALDVRDVLAFHRRTGRLATLTAVRPPARFGALELDGALVGRFSEKPQVTEGWINGGFFVFEPEVLEYIDGDEVELERVVLERLSREGQLAAYRHEGFWQCMDTLRDVRLLESLWQGGRAPWVRPQGGVRV